MAKENSLSTGLKPFLTVVSGSRFGRIVAVFRTQHHRRLRISVEAEISMADNSLQIQPAVPCDVRTAR
jgi:hypothetical protein